MGFFETLSILNLNEANSGSVLTTVSGDKFKKNNKGVWDKEIAVVDVSTKLDKPTTEKTELEATDKIVLLDSLGNSKYVLGSKLGGWNDLDPFGDGSQKAYFKFDSSLKNEVNSSQAWVSDKHSFSSTGEIVFSGTGGATLNISEIISIFNSKEYTITFCFYVNTILTTAYNLIFGAFDTTSPYSGPTFWLQSNGYLSFRSDNSTESSTQIDMRNNTKKWYFATIVADKTNIYVEITEKNTLNKTVFNAVPEKSVSIDQVNIGSNSGSTSQCFDGSLNNLRIFNKELTQTEVTTIYNKDK